MFGPRNLLPPSICGCFYAGDNGIRHYLPQVKLDSRTTILPLCFTTKLTQTFANSNAQPIKQVQYAFPLYDGVAVNAYTISFADTTLRGVVKQKDDAKQTYQAAVERGETAGLLEALPAGVFGVTLGNVPAQTDVVVEITYCGELKHDAAIDGLRYVLPTSIAPRYGEYPGEVLQSNAVAKGGISITVDVNMAGAAIRKVQSPSHPIAVSMGEVSTALEKDAFRPSQASTTLTLGNTELADDFILQLLIDDIDKPRAIIETHPALPNQRAIMATLVPRFTLESAYPEIVFIADQSGSMSGTKNAALVKALNVFLKSLPVGVRFNICPFGSHFQFLWPKSQPYTEANVKKAVDFVNTFTASYGGTEIFQPIKAAFDQRLSDLPLEVMLLTDGQIWGEQAVFDFINQQIREKKVDARVFALGVGSDVSSTLVEGVARAGNGFAQFVIQDEETEKKVVRMLKGALYAHTSDYRLEVNYADEEAASKEVRDSEDFEVVEKVQECLEVRDKPPAYASPDPKEFVEKATKSFFNTSADVDKSAKEERQGVGRYAHLPTIDIPKLLQAPSEIPPLFPFNRTTVYLLLGPESTQKRVQSIVLQATSAEGPLELTIPANEIESTDIPTVHQLAARKSIQDLEEGRGWLQSATFKRRYDALPVKEKYTSRFDELVEREAVRLGETFQVAGKWTSFVAVEDTTGKEEKEGPGDETPRNSTLSQPSSMALSQMLAPGESLDACRSISGLAGNPQLRMGVTRARKAKRSPASGLFGSGGFFGSKAGSQSFQSAPAPPPPAFGTSFAPPPAPSGAAPSPQAMTGGNVLQNYGPGPFPSAGNGARYSANHYDPTIEDHTPREQMSAAHRIPPNAVSAKGSASPFSFGSASSQVTPGGLSTTQFGAATTGTQSTPPRRSSGGLFGGFAQSFGRRSSGGGVATNATKASESTAATARRTRSTDYTAIMHQLVSLQTFYGAWQWTAGLFSTLGLEEATCKKWIGRHANVSDDVKATALVVAFLQLHLADQGDVWEMVAAKATTWMASQTALSEREVQQGMIEESKEVVSKALV